MNDPLKIALIEPVGGHGGMDYYDYGLAVALGKKGIHVFYCTSEETNLQDHTNVISRHFFNRVWSSSNKFIRLIRYLRGLNKSLKFVKKEGCRIVHLQLFELSWLNLLVLMMTRMKKLKIVVTLHDIESFHLRSNKWVERMCVKRIDEWIVHNEICKQLVCEKFTLKDIHVIPHGSYIGMVPMCEPLNKHDGPLRLLFFGQLKEVKGLDILLEAVSNLIQNNNVVNLTIAGKPWKTDLDKYKRMIRELGIEDHVAVNFRYILNDEVFDFYNQADVVVLPYRRIYQSGVLLMAMSMGRPVLASDLDSFKEILEDGQNGYLFRQGDSSSLASRILEIANRDSLQHASDNALQLMKDEFSWDRIATETEKVYFRLR